ncbi:MAG TPA: transferrin receptor-like dimerization domain-containing protein [Terriglobales bacterium]|nr:transferrin receptor-like dimerization domain-containing protein [Terriglobales bacterium]
MRSTGDYGVYHSAFDNYDWFRRFGDSTFEYSQELSRVFGLQVLRMAEADVLPYDYESYGMDISNYLRTAETNAADVFGKQTPSFTEVNAAAARFTQAGRHIGQAEVTAQDPAQLNRILIQTERSFLLSKGLPRRPWFKHAIFAPSELKVYSASVLPGISEGIDQRDVELTRVEIEALTKILNHASALLESYHPR